MMTRKQAYISLLVLAVAFTAFQELWFRRYLVRHHLHAFYLAGSLPNLVAVVLFFLAWSVIKYPLGRKDSLVVAWLVAGAMVCYELVQPLLPGRTFDIADIVASLIGGMLCMLMALALRLLPER